METSSLDESIEVIPYVDEKFLDGKKFVVGIARPIFIGPRSLSLESEIPKSVSQVHVV